jgi:acyl carrier protein
VGLTLFRIGAEALRIENLLLSCRALGRGVEHRMIQHAAEIAAAHGKRRLEIVFVEGQRNQPALSFVRALPGSTFTAQSEQYRMVDVTDAQKVDFPGSAFDGSAGATGDSRGTTGLQHRTAVRSSIDYQHIAEALHSAAAMEAAIQEKRRKQAERLSTPAALPETELQARLAAIWCDLLALPSVGINEDFFDLGGHSLLAVQLLSKIHEEFGVDLPDAVIYGEKVRIDILARAIELQQLGARDQAAYNSMLEEIESLSDDEAAALLAEEESGS